MKLGGHETFYLRPGWLTKGLFHLNDGKSYRFADLEVADCLGVGRNMSKAIGWWLYTTGLVDRKNPKHHFEISDLGKIILKFDPYMTRIGTWWLIHTSAMVTHSDKSLRWFFSYKRPYRFTRTKLINDLKYELEETKGKSPPSIKSIQREVALVLKTYSVDIPKPVVDPEDNLGSPFQRLNLILHKTATNHFERAKSDLVPPEALGICLSCQLRATNTATGAKRTTNDGSMSILSSSSLLGLGYESTIELAELGQKHLGDEKMKVNHLPGEKIVQVENLSTADWAQLYYERYGISCKGEYP